MPDRQDLMFDITSRAFDTSLCINFNGRLCTDLSGHQQFKASAHMNMNVLSMFVSRQPYAVTGLLLSEQYT